MKLTDDMAREFAELRGAGGFHVILADPPWEFGNWSEAGEGKNPNQHYDCAPIERLCELPVELLAADDCALFLWATWPLLVHPDAPVHALIKSWGFRGAGLAWEWIKFNPETGKYAFGPGYGTRKNVEPCILCTRGEPQLRDQIDGAFFGQHQIPAGVRSVRDFIQAMPLDCIRAQRREHSRKPDEQYERIDTLFAGRKLELFARQRRPGWSAWGNQTTKFGGAAA